ncbi:MAG: M1 family aminopeptidase [Polyangiaceae bacterium]|nr:M1 family aminopeptidase [Polyangiaceae bacterium]
MLNLDLPAQEVRGEAYWSFRRVSQSATSLTLDAVGFAVANVDLLSGDSWEPIEYDYDGDQFTIHIPADLSFGQLRIGYRARPERGLYFLKPDKFVKDRPVQVWSQCQDEDARYWFPCHDKPHTKMTFELEVTVPHGMVALSNGELYAESTPKGQPWSYHFKMNDALPSYLVTLVVGDFKRVSDRDAVVGPEGMRRNIPITYFVPPDKARGASRSFGETPRMVELFSRLTGVDFAWSRYSQVVVSDFIFGGMENTTATTMYEYVLLDEKAALDNTSNDLIAHELAHQWFGDLLTCRDWSHAWLNEGFATFFEHVEREDRLGKDEYEYGVASDLQAYLSEANTRYTRPIVCREYAEPIDLFDRHLYEKGGLVLHMLRRHMGDELFFSGVRRYLELHRGGIVETTDLMRAMESVSGESFEEFFDEWVFRAGHPVLKVNVSYDEKLLSVQVKQTQTTGLFALDVEILVCTKSGTLLRHQKRIDSVQDAIAVPCAEKPQWVAFDPDFKLTAPVTLTCPADMLRRQLTDAPTARLRWVAAEALGQRSDLLSVEALAKSLANEQEAWMVRSEAAEVLGKLRGDLAFQALSAALKTPHPKVRRAAVAALGHFRTPEAVENLLPLAEEDASYLVESEASRALGRTRQHGVKKALLRLLERKSWADITRAGALDGLGLLRDDSTLEALIEHSSYGKPTRGRRAAISALSQVSESRKVRHHLEELLDDPDPYLRIDVVRALVRLGDLKVRGALTRRLERETDGRVERRLREALRELVSTSKAAHGEDVEALKHELSDLKARMSKLEGRHSSKHDAAANKERSSKSATTGTERSSKDAPESGEAPAAKRAHEAKEPTHAEEPTRKKGKKQKHQAAPTEPPNPTKKQKKSQKSKAPSLPQKPATKAKGRGKKAR